MTTAGERLITDIAGLKVLFAMAAEQEYGPRLKGAITPLMTGVGPVEAAAAVGGALGALSAHAMLPDLLVSLGSAGSRTLAHAEIYQVASVSYRDIDASALGFEKGVVPFLGESRVIDIPYRLPDVPAASLSTGGAVISDSAYDAIDADMVDMETYAVVRAACRFGVPTIGLRGISDGRGALTGLHDWTEYLHILDEKLADAISGFRDHVASGRFALTRSIA
jgi:adenosylhomocysteine nucleosidase